MIVSLLSLGAALASEVPEEEPRPRRFTDGGPALGLTQLTVTGPGGTGTRYGVSLAGRSEAVLSDRFQLNVLGSIGITNPRNTVAVARFAIDVGEWSVQAFRDVSSWVARGRDRDDYGLRVFGATFAYSGLAFTFLSVPVLLAVSPLAAVGHAVFGPTMSFHSHELAPNVFFEAGLGGALYGDPVERLPALGWGPIVGVGVQTERNTIGVHAVISPPGLHASGDPPSTMVTDEVVVGF